MSLIVDTYHVLRDGTPYQRMRALLQVALCLLAATFLVSALFPSFGHGESVIGGAALSSVLALILKTS